MTVKEITDKNIWEQFATEYKPDTFLQSYAWGQYNQNIGNKIFRLGIYNEGLVGICLLSKIKAKKGSFLYAQNGPLINFEDPSVLEALMATVSEIAKEEKVDFIRFTPVARESEKTRELFFTHGFVDSGVHGVDGRDCLIIDLTRESEELFRDFRKGCKYEIKKARKMGVIIEKRNGSEALEEFFSLYEQMNKRQKFIPYSLDRFRAEKEAFDLFNMQDIFIAYLNGEPLSGAVMITHGDTVFYNHGASVIKEKVSGAHLLHWHMINYYKEKGVKNYNMWGGLSPEKAGTKHPWHGIATFKRGFGGEERYNLQGKDYPVSKKYFLINKIEKIRRKKMGF